MKSLEIPVIIKKMQHHQLHINDIDERIKHLKKKRKEFKEVVKECRNQLKLKNKGR